MEIYTSNSSFKDMPKKYLQVHWDKELIWSNEINKDISIIKIKPQNRTIETVGNQTQVYHRCKFK
jgi:hypothetical protein